MKKKELDITILRTIRKVQEGKKNPPSSSIRLKATCNKLRKAGYKGKYDLSTLIFACHTPLSLFSDKHQYEEPWVAKADYKTETGLTPEEAVGNLLLALKYGLLKP